MLRAEESRLFELTNLLSERLASLVKIDTLCNKFVISTEAKWRDLRSSFPGTLASISHSSPSAHILFISL
jgi:hypothetical protein